MPAFTQGHWVFGTFKPFGIQIDGETYIVKGYSVHAKKEHIALVHDFCDARLIAAAPELYSLLKSVVDGSAFEVDIHGHYIFTTKKAEEFRKILARIDGKEE